MVRSFALAAKTRKRPWKGEDLLEVRTSIFISMFIHSLIHLFIFSRLCDFQLVDTVVGVNSMSFLTDASDKR